MREKEIKGERDKKKRECDTERDAEGESDGTRE